MRHNGCAQNFHSTYIEYTHQKDKLKPIRHTLKWETQSAWLYSEACWGLYLMYSDTLCRYWNLSVQGISEDRQKSRVKSDE